MCEPLQISDYSASPAPHNARNKPHLLRGFLSSYAAFSFRFKARDPRLGSRGGDMALPAQQAQHTLGIDGCHTHTYTVTCADIKMYIRRCMCFSKKSENTHGCNTQLQKGSSIRLAWALRGCVLLGVVSGWASVHLHTPAS
jgi:hypothetical protein